MPVFDTLSDLDDVAARCASADPGVRRVAMLELAESVDDGAVDLLVEGLNDADAAVREAAAKALDEHTGDGVVEALAAALEDPIAAVRAAAADTLAEKKAPGSAALLIARVDHAEAFVRAAALRALRELVRPARCRRRCARSTTVARGAARGGRRARLSQGRRRTAGADAPCRRWRPVGAPRRNVGARVHPARRPGVSALLAGLRDAHWQVREQAAASIGKVKIPEAIGPLIAAMGDDNWQVRAKAANALGRICAAPAIPVLVRR